MEEVQGFLDGERDYTKIQGNTGPLVYPAGFLYIFTLLKWFTENGTNIFTAQIIFVGIYLMTLVVVLALYSLDGGISVFASILLVLSKRIHSIYMLRMFNDCIAVLCGYIAVLLFTKKSWRVGCLIYSLGVSVKMNMLLYAPGVLLVLLLGTGYIETFICLSICAAVQVLLGLPFLTTYPVQYLMKAFELSRVFTYKWTVNFKFLPEEVFVSKPLSLLLLALTVLGIVTFAAKWIREVRMCRSLQRSLFPLLM
jgi:alpha-1,3-mannosyltransferase